MPADQPALSTAWIAVSFDTDPLVAAHLEHPGSDAIGESHDGDDWREALAWARARTDRVFIRFDVSEETLWAGAGPPPGGVRPLPERPVVFVDEWIAELRRLRQQVAHLTGTAIPWTRYAPRIGAVAQVRVGCAELHRTAAFWAAVTGGTVERAAVLGRVVDGMLAAQAGVHPELLFSGQEPPGRLTLTVAVEDLDARVGRLADLGGTVVRQGMGFAVVEDPEGNRVLLAAVPPDRPV
jgi:predicted enzyme related to lactoylglutathione lyase